MSIVMLKSLFMAFLFIFSLYHSVVGITHILGGVLKSTLINVFTEDKSNFYINLYPSFLAIIGWTVFAATKGLFAV